jgi:hypothetical protein
MAYGINTDAAKKPKMHITNLGALCEKSMPKR